MEKNRFLKILCYGTYVVGFQTMVIMDLWGMAFHAMVVIGLIPALLFISTWACCAEEIKFLQVSWLMLGIKISPRLRIPYES